VSEYGIYYRQLSFRKVSDNEIMSKDNATPSRFVVNPNAALSQVLMRICPGVTNYYVYGLGLLYEVTETATNSYARYYHYDYRGSTVALTDHESRITDRLEYSAYGTLTYRIGNTDTPFLFNGRFGVQTDPNGLLYMRARYYNPYICRFINPDPIGFSGGLNWYVFADGNPVNYVDPYGLAYGNPVCGPDGQMYPSDPFAPGGAFYVPSPWEPDIMTSFVTGVAVGAAIAGAVTVGAPAAVSVLVAAGVPVTTANAAVTAGIGVTAAVGAVAMGVNTYNAVQADNWGAVAFNAGAMVGGLTVGVSGGGRAMVEGMMGKPSPAPATWNPISVIGYEWSARFRLDYPGGNVPRWLASAPTPASGGASAAFTAGGISLLFQPVYIEPLPYDWVIPSFGSWSTAKLSIHGK